MSSSTLSNENQTGLTAGPTTGLTTEEALARLEEFGPNRLPAAKTSSVAVVFLRQFLSPFIYILMVAAAVSLAVGQLPSAIFIVAVLLLNACIGAVQEFSAERSAAALRDMVRGLARVMRDGHATSVDIEEIVPGDVVLLASGDRIPADMRLTDTDGLCVDESMLTGESLAVEKDAADRSRPDAPLAERHDQCFAGAIVTRGRGQGVVSATGLNTEIGGIAEKVTQARVSEPPLMIRIRRFTYQVAGAIMIAIVALAGLMLWRGGYEATAMVMMGIGLAVSTIPEGLPAALTVALAIGMRRMANQNVIIRKLVAVEALGSCTFICSDKTGTLTVNELTIHSAILPSGRTFKASGAGIAPGDLEGAGDPLLRDLCVTGVLANESELDYAGDKVWTAEGDIVDVAFLVFAKKFGLSLGALRDAHQRRKLIPYESERAYSASINGDGTAAYLYAKGSPERILAASDRMQIDGEVVPVDRKRIEEQFEAMARQGYRMIALARRPASETPDRDGAETEAALDGLIFQGMVAMIDPIRPEARDAIARCNTGGVGVAMVTGDHPATARAIGAELGLCAADATVVSGSMIREAVEKGPDAVRDLILPARVFARIEPMQKELIVETFMADGHFVAVTGDGVNDAPAMRRANVGVAMGKSGADVAKEAADIIITDDNFASIVSGVEQGRIVYNNIRKVIGLLTATGFSALLLFFLSVLAGLPMPLTAVQLLWLNLVANGLQDVALAFEPKEGGELTRKPRHPDEPIFERHIVEHVLIAGSAMGAIAFAVYWMSYNAFGHADARNITLMLMVLFGNVHALSSRSETRSLFSIAPFANRFLAIATPGALALHLVSMHIPGLSGVLDIHPISPPVFAGLVAAALAFFLVEETHKFSIRRHRHGGAPEGRPVEA